MDDIIYCIVMPLTGIICFYKGLMVFNTDPLASLMLTGSIVPWTMMSIYHYKDKLKK